MGFNILKYMDLIKNQFTSTYEENKLIKCSIEEYVIKNQNDIVTTYNNATDDILKFNAKVKKNKVSWISIDKKNINSKLNVDINKRVMSFNLYKEANSDIVDEAKLIENYKSAYKESVDEYITRLYNDLNTWADSDDYFSNYPYISSRGGKAITTALMNDVVRFLLNYIKKEEIEAEHIIKKELNVSNGVHGNRGVVSIPTPIVSLKEDTNNRLTVSIEEYDNSDYITTSENEQNRLLMDRNKFEDLLKKNIGINISLEDINEKINNTKVFNALDRQIFTYITSNAFLAIYKEDYFTRPIIDIIKSIGLSNSVQNRKNVKESLFKLASSEFSKDGETMAHFFDVALTHVEKHGKDVECVSIWLGGMLKTIIKTGNAVSFFADKYHSLSADAQKILCYIQNERITRAINGDKDTTLYITIEGFMELIRFKSQRYVKKRLREALDELKNNNLVVKDWKLLHEIYTINFYKIPDKDLEKITGKDFKKVNYIESGFNIVSDLIEGATDMNPVIDIDY